MATALIANDVEPYAFRSEPEGIYNGLSHADKLQSTQGIITQYCDCEGVVQRATTPIKHPRDTMAPEADIVMAIQHTINSSMSDIGILHTKGHQDDTTTYKALPFLSQ